MEDILTILGALGGFEFVKWVIRFFTNRKNDKLTDDTMAEREKYKTLESHIEFLQNELKEKEQRFVDKEKRFVEQTERLRATQDQLYNAEREKAAAELELALKRCEVKKCPKREPQNGY